MTFGSRLDAVVDAALGARIVGCVILVSEGGRRVYARAAGQADREAGSPMREDTVFRLASVTKPIVATAALRMVEDGRIGLDDPVSRYLPWFTPPSPDGTTNPILLRHLLTHTSGITYDVPADVAGGLAGPLVGLEENLRRLARQPLAFAPGRGWAYGMSIDLLGGVLAAVTGGTLADAVAEAVTQPLGMIDTRFGVADPTRLAAAYADDRPPRLMAEPETVLDADGGGTVFSPGRIFRASEPESGGAGMAGTAGDVLSLLEAYQRPGFLRAETIRAALANQIGDLSRRPQDAGKGFSFIGAVTLDPDAAGWPVPAGTVDWGGAYGHNWVVDPANGLSIAVLTNTAFEGCNGPFRLEVLKAIYGR